MLCKLSETVLGAACIAQNKLDFFYPILYTCLTGENTNIFLLEKHLYSDIMNSTHLQIGLRIIAHGNEVLSAVLIKKLNVKLAINLI